MGYIVHCEKCLYRESLKGPYLKMGRSCPECGTGMKVAGPMWLGELANQVMCTKMLEKAKEMNTSWERRLESIIKSVRAEIGYPPTFIQIDEISSHLHIGSQNLKALLSKLEAVGYRATTTHFSPRGIKTDATVIQLANVLKD
jgi:tRNA (guanine26-N2/guanine27-N2)-dimethyltransferase